MLRADAFLSDTPTSTPRLQPIEGVPTRLDVAFTDRRGMEKKGVRKDAEKMLKKLAPALRRLLGQDEFVVYLAGACAPMSFLEQYTFGYFAQFVSRAMLVFTNKRLLAFRVKHNGDWRQNLRGCWLGDVQSAKLTGWVVGYLRLQYASGKKESYWALKSRDKSKLKAILPKLLEANAGQTPAQAMQAMCPSCGASLAERQYECSACGQKFRIEDSLWWRSFIPGAVYFYARQTGMGLLHAVVDTFILLEFLLVLSAALTAKPQQRAPDLWITVAVITFILLLERSIALWHARRFLREFIPIEGTGRTQGAAASR